MVFILVKVVIVNLIDFDVVVLFVKVFNKVKILVIMVDCSFSSGDVDFFIVFDNIVGGIDVVKKFVEIMGDKGEVIYL